MSVNRVQTFVRSNLTTLILASLAGGFLLLLAELLLAGHTEGVQLVGVTASILGILLALVGLKARGTARNVLAVLFLVLAISGVVGAFEHNEERFEGEEAKAPILLNQSAGRTETNLNIAYRMDSDDGNEGKEGEAREGSEAGEAGEAGEEGEEEGESNPPPLAPLSLSGLSLLGALALLGKEDETD